ncbi:MAG: acyl carrier protein [Holophagales bacterium]|nr:acyl carrier protein [Holophagales bacterium]MYG30889.1 acyl carrier protein [Holophagales bacterium]MYI80372.1 acyl carrier protein [Holophagales bacterium]
MRIFDRLSGWLSSSRAPDPEPQPPPEPSSDPEAHRPILEYVKRVWAGEDPDPVFEKKSLTHDVEFDSLHLAELIFALSEDLEIPMERILQFLRTGIPGGGDQKLATLLERIVMLSKEFNSSDRFVLLSSGVVGDRAEVAPIVPPFDNVAFVVKFCGAIKSLKNQQGHDAPDITHVTITDDPGWPSDED